MKKTDRKLPYRHILAIGLAALTLGFSGCGSSSGMNSDGSGTDTPEPTYNFTGTVFSSSGSTFSGLDVYVFSDMQQATTDTSGKFSLEVSRSLHTLLVEKSGFVTQYQPADLAAGQTIDLSVILSETHVNPVTLLASQGSVSPIISNTIENNTVTLLVPAQSAPFKVWDEDRASVSLTLENIDLNTPLPVPMPAPSNTAADAIKGGEGRTPRILVSLQPATLELTNPAVLTFPDFTDQGINQILRFNFRTHQWEAVPGLTDRSVPVQHGGIYGQFYDNSRNASVRGAAEVGSIIAVGDSVVSVGSEEEFYVDGVPVPPAGSAAVLAIGPADADTGKRSVMQTSIALESGAQASVSFGKATATPQLLAIGASGNEVKSDNSDFVIVTATVLDVNNAPIRDVAVSFRVDSGVISSTVDLVDGEVFDPNNVMTDQDGSAQVKFSSGIADRSNRLVSVTASINELTPKSIPIQVTGSTLTLATEKNSLSLDEQDYALVTITASDASGGGVYDEPVAVSVSPEGAMEWTASPASYRTNISGAIELSVKGKKTGAATLTIKALGATVTSDFTVTSEEDQFSIVYPGDDPAYLSTNASLTIVVQAPSQNTVRFSTSFGKWDNGLNVKDVAVVNKQATAVLQSPDAGLATIQVYDLANEDVNDSAQVAISAPSSEASQIALQPGSTTVNPSTGDMKNSVSLEATVKNSRDQVVGGAPILFSLSRTTGGGEYVTPVVVYTDASGVARSTFFSGVLPSDNQGVTVTAQVIGKASVNDDKSIIIGKTPGSVVIGHAIEAVANEQKTTYTVSISTVISDTAGNPVAGADVSLSAWPSKYATGYWTKLDPCEPVYTGQYWNEDINRNLILDPGEDLHEAGAKGYGELTPPNSSAGSITPAVAQTDENGVAYFDLTYLNNDAAWIQTELTASTMAFGTESQSTLKFWLPWIEKDSCLLPDSPFDPPKGEVAVGAISLQAEKTIIFANGTDSTKITATLKDANGRLAGSDVPVTFEITGPGGFPSFQQTVVKTGDDGGATAEYTGPVGLGGGSSATITVSALNYNSADITLALGAGEIFLEAQEEPTLVADGAATISFLAYIIDTSNQYVSTSERIDLKITGNAGGSVPSSVFTQNGSASFKYTAPYGLPLNQMSATVQLTASALTGAVSAPVTITLNREKVASIALKVNEPVSIPADGTSSTTITATLTNDSGNPVIKGTPVVFTTTAGRFPDTDGDGNPKTYTTFIPDSGDAVSTGKVTVSLISAASADPITAEVTCKAGGISQKVSVPFTAAVNLPPATIELKESTGSAPNPNPAVINVKGTWKNKSSSIKFIVNDKNGHAVADGYRINFFIENGPNAGEILSTSYAETVDGEVSVVLKSGIRLGTVVLKAVYKDDSAVFSTAQVTIVGGLPVGESFELWQVLVADNMNSITNVNIPIAANVSDIYGNTVADGTRIFFKTYNMGGFVAPASSPTVDGLAVGDTQQIDDTDLKIGTVFSFPVNIPPEGVTITAETEGGPSTRITSLAVIPVSEFSQVLFAGTNGGGIYKSVDSGTTWNNMTRSPEISGQNWIDPYVNDVVYDPDDYDRIYAATGLKGYGYLYRSDDGGVTWTAGGRSGTGFDGAPVLTAICDDNGSEWLWVGLEQKGIRYSKDGGDTFEPPPAGMGSVTVTEIVKVQGNGAGAVLYAGSSAGVYVSADGGKTWAETPGSFTGDYITAIDAHPSSNGSGDDIIYVGTEDAGVWVSRDSGENWIQYTSGMAENERNIRDLLVDEGNNRLYAATYYFGNLDAHAVGNLYVHELKSNGTMEIGIWEEANTGLPPFDDDDPTLLAQHVLAAVPNRLGDFYQPRALFIGGEGISLLRTESGLDTGALSWTSRKDGLSNTIMARLYISYQAMLERINSSSED
ncbi:MAG: hypothetical protein CSB33_02670 [Desulfobacterales bacterium]|nr:MAG: hypothetical protein CSB33_02670 [Desulfobacterales bacterium]